MKQALLDPEALKAERMQLIEYWTQRAHALRPQAMAELAKIPDEPLQNLYCKNKPIDSSEDLELGTFVHFPLLRELAQACEAEGQKYVEEFLSGFPVVGPIPRSGR